MTRTRKRGPRSLYATQKREAARIVSTEAHRDRVKAESIHIMTPADLYDVLSRIFNRIFPEILDTWERAEVLSDALGRGSQQVME